MTQSTIVHVVVQSSLDVPEDDRWLGAEELRVLAGLRFPKRRAEWRLGRWTAKLALRALDLDQGGAVIMAAADGAPEAFAFGAPLPVALSISHRDGLACCAIGPRAVALGCDLETVEPRSTGFVLDVFTDAERAALQGARHEDLPVLVALGWSAKEAVLKARRTGLRSDVRSVAVDLRALAGEVLGEPRTWSAISARDDLGRTYAGRWRREGSLVLTVLSDPPCETVRDLPVGRDAFMPSLLTDPR